MKPATHHQAQLGGHRIPYQVVRSGAARRLRVRVGLAGVEVVQPAGRDSADVLAFLHQHEGWILDQLRRVARLRSARRAAPRRAGEILFRGDPTQVSVETTTTRARGNAVDLVDGEIVVRRGAGSHTPVARSLENWLRKQARTEIEGHLAVISARVGQRAHRVYVRGQRTKWGSCSTRGNLSFNWRLILAPDFVLRYLVTHEAVHLAIPDHSAQFWLTVQSLCPATERAKQWLCRHHAQVTIDLERVLDRASATERLSVPQ